MTAHPRWLAPLLFVALGACGDNPQKLMASARDYMAKGDTNAAVIQLKTVLQKEPDLAEARYLFGMSLLENGDAQGAERELRKALDKGYPLEQIAVPLASTMIGIGKGKDVIPEYTALKPATPDAVAAVQTGLGNAYLVAGERDKATAAIDAALAAKPDYPAAQLARVRSLLIANDVDAAFRLLDPLTKVDSVRFDALMLRADTYAFQGKMELALQDLATAAPLRPQLARPNLRMAQILLGQGKTDEAEARLAVARKLSPGNPMIRFLGGVIALKQEKYQAARDAAEQVLRVAPEFQPAMLLAGTAQLRLKQFLQAQESLEKVVTKSPGNAGARVLLARAYLGGGDAVRALETLDPLVTSERPSREVLAAAGEAALRTGNLKLSSEYLDRAARLDPKDPGARMRLGVARLMGGDAEGAVEDLETASTLAGADAGGTTADIALAMLHVRRGENDKAREVAEGYVKKHPDQAFAHNLLGGVLGAIGDKKGQRAALEKALSLDPAFLPAAVNLAGMDRAEGKPEAGRKRLEAVIAKSPRNADAYLVLARYLAESAARPDEIRALLDKGIAANPGVAALKLAEVDLLLRTGDKKGALGLAQDIIAASPNDPSALLLAARAQAAGGDLQQGMVTMQKVVSLQPNAVQPLVALADMQTMAKNESAAEVLLAKALTMRPEQTDVRARLVALKIAQKKTGEAVARARELQKLRPRDPAGYGMEGDAQFFAKDYPAAVASYGKALELGNQPLQAMWLHRALLASGKAAEADALAARWLKANPNDVLMRNYLGERAISARAWNDAARMYRSLIEIDPNNASAFNNLAWVAGQLKDPQAMSYADKALALAPDSPPILDTKGNLQLDAGQVGDGVATLKRAVSLAPDRGEYRLSLARGLIRSGDKNGARGEINTVLKSAPNGSALRQDAETLLKTL